MGEKNNYAFDVPVGAMPYDWIHLLEVLVREMNDAYEARDEEQMWRTASMIGRIADTLQETMYNEGLQSE